MYIYLSISVKRIRKGINPKIGKMQNKQDCTGSSVSRLRKYSNAISNKYTVGGINAMQSLILMNTDNKQSNAELNLCLVILVLSSSKPWKIMLSNAKQF